MSETTYDLNWQIAVELGWTDLKIEAYWGQDYSGGAEDESWVGIPPWEKPSPDGSRGYCRLSLPRWDSDLNAAMPLYQEFLKAKSSEVMAVKTWLDKSPQRMAHDMALTWLMWKRARAVVYGDDSSNVN